MKGAITYERANRSAVKVTITTKLKSIFLKHLYFVLAWFLMFQRTFLKKNYHLTLFLQCHLPPLDEFSASTTTLTHLLSVLKLNLMVIPYPIKSQFLDFISKFHLPLENHVNVLNAFVLVTVQHTAEARLVAISALRTISRQNAHI